MIGATETRNQVTDCENNNNNTGAGGVRAYISPSRLNLWLRCPLAFKLRYIDGIRTPTTPSLFLGKQVHAGLETLNRYRMLGIILSSQDIAARIANNWAVAVAEESMEFDSRSDEVALRQKTVDLVTVYISQLPADSPAPTAVEVRMEVPLVDPLSGEDLGIPLLGVVDLIVPDDHGALILDYKTAARSSSPFEISHEIQLTAYSYMYRELAGQRESGLEVCSLIKTKKPKIEHHRYAARSDRHLARFFSVIREYLDALDTGRFNFRPSWSSCGMCDFREGLCANWGG